MIIDTSALLPIVLTEHDESRFLSAIVSSRSRAISVANWLEATIVVESRGDSVAGSSLEQFVRDAQIKLIDVTVEQADLARDAWRKFGRGRHRARLNFGDCFAYSLAKMRREPLLFKGDDFAQTDFEPALKR